MDSKNILSLEQIILVERDEGRQVRVELNEYFSTHYGVIFSHRAPGKWLWRDAHPRPIPATGQGTFGEMVQWCIEHRGELANG